MKRFIALAIAVLMLAGCLPAALADETPEELPQAELPEADVLPAEETAPGDAAVPAEDETPGMPAGDSGAAEDSPAGEETPAQDDGETPAVDAEPAEGSVSSDEAVVEVPADRSFVPGPRKLTVASQLREKANGMSVVLAELPAGTEVRLLEKKGDWFFASWKDGAKEILGYLHKRAFEPAPAESAEAAPEEAQEEPADEAAGETAAEIPEETADETSAETSEEAAEESADETPDETPEEAAEESADETSAETPEEAAEESADETPDETPGEAAEETADETSAETPEEAAEEPADETPEEASEEPAGETPEESADETGEEAPEAEEPEEVPEESVPRKVTIFTSRRAVMRVGEQVELTSLLEGFDGDEVRYQWECDKGEGFMPVEGADGASYVFTADEETLRWTWRLVVYYR